MNKSATEIYITYSTCSIRMAKVLQRFIMRRTRYQFLATDTIIITTTHMSKDVQKDLNIVCMCALLEIGYEHLSDGLVVTCICQTAVGQTVHCWCDCVCSIIFLLRHLLDSGREGNEIPIAAVRMLCVAKE